MHDQVILRSFCFVFRRFSGLHSDAFILQSYSCMNQTLYQDKLKITESSNEAYRNAALHIGQSQLFRGLPAAKKASSSFHQHSLLFEICHSVRRDGDEKNDLPQ